MVNHGRPVLTFLFQDGGCVPPVTSPRAVCKRSIIGLTKLALSPQFFKKD